MPLKSKSSELNNRSKSQLQRKRRLILSSQLHRLKRPRRFRNVSQERRDKKMVRSRLKIRLHQQRLRRAGAESLSTSPRLHRLLRLQLRLSSLLRELK